jgi:DUF1680 family protein
MKAEDGFVALLYGPSTLTTNYNGVNLKIEEQTNYPFSDDIKFIITVDKDVDMKIYLRKPNWSKDLNIEIDNAKITQENGYYIIHKTWKTGDTIQISFVNEIFPVVANNSEVAVQRGALVYALEIPHREEVIKEYEIEGFKDYMVFSTDDLYKNLNLVKSENDNSFGLSYVKDKNHQNPWYDGNAHLIGELYNTELEKLIKVKLVPMGGTTLRRVTFPIKKP